MHCSNAVRCCINSVPSSDIVLHSEDWTRLEATAKPAALVPEVLKHLLKLLRFHRDHPLSKQPDQVQLTRAWHALGDVKDYIIAWALREPALVCAFLNVKCGIFGDVDPLVVVSHCWQHVKRCHQEDWNHKQWLTPDVILGWSSSLLQQVATKLNTAATVGDLATYEDYKTVAARLSGFGVYNVEHLYRSVMVSEGKPHPCTTFVNMGRGANAKVYLHMFRKWHIHNMHDVHVAIAVLSRSHGWIATLRCIDAGELAYLCCQQRRS